MYNCTRSWYCSRDGSWACTTWIYSFTWFSGKGVISQAGCSEFWRKGGGHNFKYFQILTASSSKASSVVKSLWNHLNSFKTWCTRRIVWTQHSFCVTRYVCPLTLNVLHLKQFSKIRKKIFIFYNLWKVNIFIFFATERLTIKTFLKINKNNFDKLAKWY